MSKELNRIAEHYLQELLQKNPTVEFQKVIPLIRQLQCSDYSDADAEKFVSQIQTESERIDISETTLVNVLRMCPRNMPQYFAGFRKDGKPVWSFCNHLAPPLNQCRAEEALDILKQQGFECFVLPVMEMKHGSL